MSLYTKIRKWADGRETDRLSRLARKNNTADKPLTKAYFVNALHSLDGELGKWFEQTGSNIVQRTHEIVTKGLGDTVAVCAELVRQQSENMQIWTDKTYRLYDNSMRSFFSTTMDYLQTLERNNAGRYLTLVEKQDVLQGTQVALFENLTEQIQALKAPHVIYEPSLAWVMDNIDELVRLGIAVEAWRNNNAPANIAKVHAVKSLCAMLGVGMIEAKVALDGVAKNWGDVELAEAA